MQFDSLAALWWMNGHGPFVWSAYAIAAVTLIAIVWVPLQRRRRFFAEQSGSARRRDLRSAVNNSVAARSTDNGSSAANSAAKAP